MSELLDLTGRFEGIRINPEGYVENPVLLTAYELIQARGLDFVGK